MRDLSGSFWKLRKRFGIAAPRVAIHSQVPWYWRWVGVAVLLGVAAASAAWFYDAGRRFAGFDRSEVQQELARVTGELEAERTAQQKLAQQIRTLEKENARVREELATFESMISSEARNAPTLSIYRFKVEPELLPGEYRYRLLLVTPSTRRERDFNGRMELVVSLKEGDDSAMMSFPEPADADAGAFRLAFKYFRRVEGTFRVNPKAKVESVQVRVYETGSTQPRATHSVSL